MKIISDSPALDAELLLAHCLKKNRTYCHTWPEHELTQSEQSCFEEAITLRKDDYPVAYILGTKSFWTFNVEVTPDVLIPRPDTELLVEVALEKIADVKNPKILDLGTGSGVIALALASERPDASIMACDSSKQALEVAKRNAVTLKLDNQVSFIKSNWFEEITDNNFNLIVSNPPYIDPEDTNLSGTIRYEPQEALISNNKGMQDIENIIKSGKNFLQNKGWIVLEHGYDQNEKTTALFSQYDYTKVKSVTDLDGNWRVTLANLN